jgi:glycolate oxidase iron-sulfur subunit
MCLPACPTYGITGSEAESPRGRLFLMGQFDKGQITAEQLKPHLDACLGCVACQTACPSGVQYGYLLTAHRQNLASLTPWWQRAAKRFAFRWVLPNKGVLNRLTPVLRWGQQQVMNPDTPKPLYKTLQRWVANTPELSWLWRLLPPVPQQASPFAAGQTFGEAGNPIVALMTGCMMDALYHRTHQATIDVLVTNGYQVIIPPQTCCGALALHAGEKDIALHLAKQNLTDALLSADYVVLNSAGCGATLKEYDHLLAGDAQYASRASQLSQKVVDVMVLLAQKPLKTLPKPDADCLPLRVTYHGACHLHHAQNIKTEPFAVLTQLPGIDLVPLPGFDRCCGSAGIYNVEQPELSQLLLDEKMDNVTLTEAQVVLAGNPGCLVQMQAGLQGKPVALLHPVELIAYCYGTLSLPELDALRTPADEEATA